MREQSLCCCSHLGAGADCVHNRHGALARHFGVGKQVPWCWGRAQRGKFPQHNAQAVYVAFLKSTRRQVCLGRHLPTAQELWGCMVQGALLAVNMAVFAPACAVNNGK